MMRMTALLMLLMIASEPALAGDLNPPAGPVVPTGRFGPRIEINQDTTPGDAFSTFVIAQPGSYYLAGNEMGEGGKRGINIEASGVTIDLMGFELVGVATSGIGIRAEFGVTNITIRNGTIRNWGSAGINILSAANSVLTGLICESNGGDGLTAGRSTVSQCVARQNGSNGIAIAFGTMSQCVADENDGAGLFIGLGTLSDSTSFNNAGSGIVGDGATIIGCFSSTNGLNGISALNGSVVASSSAVANGEHGISLVNKGLIINNLCDGNGTGGAGAGIFASGEGNRIEANNALDNPIGIDVDGAGNLIIKNSARGNTTEYDIVAGNAVGSIIGGGNIVSSNPWANIDY